MTSLTAPTATLAVLALLLGAAAAGTSHGDAAALHVLRIAPNRPPCSAPSGLPVVPSDPAAGYAGSIGRCYGTRPAELELRLPADRLVWLDAAPGHPVEWIEVGPLWVNPRGAQPPPLGLRLTPDGDGATLEIRRGHTASLTRLEPGVWRAVELPDGQTVWMMTE